MTSRPRASSAGTPAALPIDRALTARKARGSVKRLKRDPDFDTNLGAKIRAARVGAGMRQSELGEAVGVTFQQVQ